MEQSASAAVEFPLAFCIGCDREVLTYVGSEDDDPRLCVHCDAPVSDALLRTASMDDIASAGYGEVAPAKSCGTGGCGSGGCGR